MHIYVEQDILSKNKLNLTDLFHCSMSGEQDSYVSHNILGEF